MHQTDKCIKLEKDQIDNYTTNATVMFLFLIKKSEDHLIFFSATVKVDYVDCKKFTNKWHVFPKVAG